MPNQTKQTTTTVVSSTSIAAARYNQTQSSTLPVLGKSVLFIGLVGLMVLPFIYNPHPFVVVPEAPITVGVKAKPAKPKPYVETYIPTHQTELPNFAAIRDIATKKQTFFDYLKPHVIAENQRIEQQRQWLLTVQAHYQQQQTLSEDEQSELLALYEEYRIEYESMSLESRLNELLSCIDEIPLSLVLMQAANESAWGTSRFARLGLNFFGQWCYSEGCGVVPNGRPEGMLYEVKAFDTVAHSVQGYFLNINSNPAYQLLRDIRADLRANNLPLQAEILATGLLAYSSRGDHYIDEISKMITVNERYLAD